MIPEAVGRAGVSVAGDYTQDAVSGVWRCFNIDFWVTPNGEIGRTLVRA